jgi:hypothetical protein
MINYEIQFKKNINKSDFNILVSSTTSQIPPTEIANRPIMEFRKHLFNYVK